MKTIWTKVPAWIRAIILNLVLLFPVITLIQRVIPQTLTGATWGWGIFPVIVILIGYWFLTKKLFLFKGDQYIKHSMSFNYKDTNTWLKFLGIFLVIICLGQIFIGLTPSEGNRTLNAILSFRALPAPIAIPLLLAMALMAGVVEEVTYRGFMQNTTSNYPKWLSFLIIGVLFSITHRLPWQLFIPYVVMSMGFSVVAHQQKTLGLVVIAHVFTDFMIFIGIYYQILDFTSVTPQVIALSIAGTGLGGYLLLRDMDWAELGVSKLNMASKETVDIS